MLTYIKHFLGNKQVLMASGLLMLFLAILVPISNAKAGDCSENSVITCGISSLGEAQGAYNNNSGGVKTMFNYYGINPNDSAGVVNGMVYKDGTVVVDNKVVATGAWSMGRQSIGNSTQKTIDGTTFFVRTTNDSFAADRLPAFVKVVNGQFKWAIVKSCGNPIKAHPTSPETPKVPSYTISKKVVKDLGPTTDAAFWNGQENVSAKSGEVVRFVSMTTNNGQVTLNGALSDKLPNGLTYVSGSWQKKSGGVVTRGSTDNTGAAWYSLKPGDELKIDVRARFSAKTKVINTACTVAKEIPGYKCDTATVTPVTPPPVQTPSAKCESLTATKLSTTSFRFNTKASVANGAKVTGYVYNFGDNQTKTVNTNSLTNTVDHNYAKSFKYAVSVIVKTTVGDKVCNVGVDVSIPTPSATCESLTATKLSYNKFKFTTKAAVENGAKVTGYVYDFGDDKGQTVNTSSLTNTVEHTYAKSFKYAVKVTVQTTAGNKVCYVGAEVKIPTPAVTIDKKVDNVEKKEVKVGQNFTYQVKVTNTGDIDLKNVVVGDTAPAGVTLKSADKGTIKTPTTWNYTIPELKKGQSMTFNLVGVVKAYKAGNLVNIACVNAKEVNPTKPDAVDACDDAVVTVKVQTPNVKIDKKVDNVEKKEVKVGQEFTYQLVVKNTGDVDLKNVKVADSAPAGVTLTKADFGTIRNPATIEGADWEYTIPSLKIGESKTFKLTGIVKTYVAGELKNIACVNAPEVNPTKPNEADDCDDAIVTVTKQNPKIDIEKTSSITDGVEGQEFVYKLKVKNTGDVDLTNAKVTDKAPTGIKFLSADKGSVSADGKSYNATIANIKVGQTVEISIKAKVAGATGSVKNTACVDAVETPEDECDDVVIDIKKPNVSIDKKVDGVENKEVKVGAEFTYQLVVKNTGEVDLKNVSVRDAAPAGVTLISTDKGSIDAAKRNLSYIIPELKVGQSISINLKAKVVAYQAGNLVNTACVNAKEVNPNEPTNADDCDTATVTVTANPKLNVEKRVTTDLKAIGKDGYDKASEKAVVSPNDTVRYIYKVTNTGDVTLTNVKVKDYLPKGIEYVSGDPTEAVIKELKPGMSVYFEINAKAMNSGINKVCVTDDTNDDGKIDLEDCDTAEVEVNKKPMLDVEKKVTTDLNATGANGFNKALELVEVQSGSNVRFIIRFTNTGNMTLENVSVRDYLPTELVAAQGSNLKNVIKSIGKGQSVYIEFNAKATADGEGKVVTNYVCAADNDEGYVPESSREECAKVCDGGEINADRYDCDEAQVKIVKAPVTPGPETPGSTPGIVGPSILPKTGAGMLGLGSVIAAVGASIRRWVISRRRLQSALLNG
jgi:uncharacterized repeat protein (TIGR01451 family)